MSDAAPTITVSITGKTFTTGELQEFLDRVSAVEEIRSNATVTIAVVDHPTGMMSVLLNERLYRLTVTSESAADERHPA